MNYEHAYKELLAAAMKVRKAQITYHNAPGNPRDNMTKQALLGQSKAAEKELDDLLNPKVRNQTEMFNN